MQHLRKIQIILILAEQDLYGLSWTTVLFGMDRILWTSSVLAEQSIKIGLHSFSIPTNDSFFSNFITSIVNEANNMSTSHFNFSVIFFFSVRNFCSSYASNDIWFFLQIWLIVCITLQRPHWVKFVIIRHDSLFLYYYYYYYYFADVTWLVKCTKTKLYVQKLKLHYLFPNPKHEWSNRA